MKTINLQKLASIIQAYKNCIKSGNKEWEQNHLEYIEAEQKKLPHGSGIDGKCEFDIENCTPTKIVIYLEYHHMNEDGYCGWTEHNLIITPTFGSCRVSITGKNKNDIKDYLRDTFEYYFI